MYTYVLCIHLIAVNSITSKCAKIVYNLLLHKYIDILEVSCDNFLMPMRGTLIFGQLKKCVRLMYASAIISK